MNKKLTIENTRGLIDPCIYMLTAPNGKIYVGSAWNGFHKRSESYRAENAHGVIDSALKKYRAINFDFLIIESSKAWDKSKMQDREQYYLDTLQPFKPKGYNIARVAGMAEPMTRCVSQFTRSGVFVKEYESASQAARDTSVNQSSVTACCRGKLKSAGGFLWLYPENVNHQEIARIVKREVNKKRKKTISQYTRAGVFVASYPSAIQVSRETGFGNSCIGDCCIGKKPSAGGFIWLYSEDVNEQEIARRVKIASDRKLTKAVNQYTKAGIFVTSYPSASEAARETGVHVSNILQCAGGKKPSAGGFLWIYFADVSDQEIAQRVEQAAGAVSTYKRRVSQYTRAGIFVASYPSPSQAARETGVHVSNITRCCKVEAPSAGGYLWLYSEDVNEQEIAQRVERAAIAIMHHKRAVSQYTRAGIFVKEYSQMVQAARDTGVNAGSISQCCKGKQKSAGGFIWKYT